MAKLKLPSVKATAKVEAVAKASYSRKHSSTEVIPPDVTRAKAGAWLDLISPLSEWAGLKGDALRYKRNLLRLQREDVLDKIAERCKQQLVKDARPIAPVPNKFLVPFLEQASLEEPTSALIDMWASLLASASQDFSPSHVHFVTIISKLSQRQAEIFREIVGTEDLDEFVLSMDDVRVWFQSHSIRHAVTSFVPKDLPKKASDDDLCEVVGNLMDCLGISVVNIAAENRTTKDYFDMSLEYMTYKDDDEVSYAILEAAGLISLVETGFFKVSNWDIALTYYYVTTLGLHFAQACRLVK